jgi:hypothetical protein
VCGGDESLEARRHEFRIVTWASDHPMGCAPRDIYRSFVPAAGDLARDPSYMRLTDQWGAFAAAPFVAMSIFASAGLGTVGVVILLWMALRRRFDLLLAASTVLAASLFVYASLTR